MLTDISFSESTPGPALSRARASVKTQIFSGYAAYRVHETSDMSVDLAGGFRWFSTNTDIGLIGGAGNGINVGTNSTWTDPLIGLMVEYQFSDRWSGTGLLDYGGFDSNEETWQVLLTVGYALNDNWMLRGGYRHIEVENTINGSHYSFEQSGPIFGATYSF